MEANTPAAVWRQKPRGAIHADGSRARGMIWHAFSPTGPISLGRKVLLSLCRKVPIDHRWLGPPVGAVPGENRCEFCSAVLHLPRTPRPRPARPTGAAPAQSDRVQVEILGGPEDGMRLILDIVREGPNRIRVLERSYTRKLCARQASDVDQESGG